MYNSKYIDFVLLMRFSFLSFSSFISGVLGEKTYNHKIVNEISKDLYSHFSNADAYDVYGDAVGFLQAVRENHPSVEIGVISNFDKRVVGILDQLELSQFFSFTLYSESANCSKPNLGIFDSALTSSKSSAPWNTCREVVHIGDDFKNDYQGAKNAGWMAKLINRSGLHLANVDENDSFSDFNSLYYALVEDLE